MLPPIKSVCDYISTTITVLYHPPPGELGVTVVATVTIAPRASRSKAKDINCAIPNECCVGATSLACGVSPSWRLAVRTAAFKLAADLPGLYLQLTIIEFFRLFDSFFRVVDWKRLGLTRRNIPKDQLKVFSINQKIDPLWSWCCASPSPLKGHAGACRNYVSSFHPYIRAQM